MQLNARTVKGMSEEEIFKLPPGIIELSFDDGYVTTNYGEIATSWYLWEIHRVYPKTPLLKTMFLGSREVSSDMHTDILSTCYWAAFEAYDRTLDIEELGLLACKAQNRLFNAVVTKMGRYVTSKDMFSFVDLAEYPPIKELAMNCKPTEASIQENHAKAEHIIQTDPGLDDYPIAQMGRSKLVPSKQILQTAMPMGYRTDRNSKIFSNPIMSNITSGIITLHDHMIESRSASKALSFAKDPLRTAEYFNRKLQLVCGNIKTLYPGDCGSTRHLTHVMHKADLEHMAGSYYLTPKGYLPIIAGDKTLIGQKLQIRNPLFCRHNDTQGVCMRCFGEIGYNIPKTAAIGHVSATALCEPTTQIIMSTKHLDGSSTVGAIEFSEEELRYVYVNDKDTFIFLSPRLKGKNIRVVMHPTEALRLNDISYVKNVRTLNVHNLTALSEVRMIVEGKQVAEEEFIGVSVGSRLSALTHEALQYLLSHPWSVTRAGEIEINLTEWNFDQPLFVLPRKHTSMVEYVVSIEAMAIGNGKSKKRSKKGGISALHTYTDPEEALMHFYELVTSALRVNITHLGVIMRSLLVRDLINHDYNIPTKNDPIVFGKFREIMAMRSLGGKMAYQEQADIFVNPLSYTVQNRPSHILDPLLVG